MEAIMEAIMENIMKAIMEGYAGVQTRLTPGLAVLYKVS